MKRAAALLCLLALGACSKKEEAPQPESAPAVQAAPDPWPGKYEGDLMVNVTGYPGGRRVWLLVAKADGCTGDIGLADMGVQALESADGRRLDATVPTQTKGQCKIAITRRGKSVTVSEVTPDACASLRGATCSFNGSATRVGN